MDRAQPIQSLLREGHRFSGALAAAGFPAEGERAQLFAAASRLKGGPGHPKTCTVAKAQARAPQLGSTFALWPRSQVENGACYN